MILKVERYKGKTQNQDWWLLDDIRKISKEEFEEPFGKDFSDTEAEMFIFDYREHLSEFGGGLPESRKVIKLVCRLADYSEYTIVFDTIAYICNDEGRTIEKVAANYRHY